MPPQIVLEIKRFKIAKEVWSTSKSRRIVAFAEGSYHGKVVKSIDSKVYNGTKFCLPWNETLQRLQINFYFIDDLLTIDIGTALYAISEDGKFGKETAKTEAVLKIYPVGATVPVGRAMISISVQEMFDDENTGFHKCAVAKQSVIDHDFAVPGFRFKRLSRVLHWERIRSFNVSQTVQNGDVRSLLTCLDDVTSGDVSQEDIDPQLYKALQLAQYGAQYMLSCRKVMKDRESVLKKALKTFQQEEELLDLKLAKLRARDKALRREARDLDELTVEYSSALKDVNPRLINTLYKTYQEKVRIPHTEQLVEMADQRELDYEDEIDGYPRRKEHYQQQSVRKAHAEKKEPHRMRNWEEAPPVSDQMNLQPREPHVYDLENALGPRRTLRPPVLGSSRQIGDPWADTDSKISSRSMGAKGWAEPPSRRQREEDERVYAKDDVAAPSEKWKSTTVASSRDIQTNITRHRTVVDDHHAAGDGRRVQSESDNDSDDGASGRIKRVVSRTEFPVVSVQPMLRTLSVRSINVNPDALRSPPKQMDDPITANMGTSQLVFRNPEPSASVEVSSQSGQSAIPLHTNTDRSLFNTARLATVQQSTGDMSTATTAMSVDSLNPRMTPVSVAENARNQTRQQDYDRNVSRYQDEQGETSELSHNNESYEAVDMSNFVRHTDNSYRDSSQQKQLHRNMRVEDFIADDVRNSVREQNLDATSDSYLVEEFEDSLHMDHRPISGFSGAQEEPVRVSGVATPGRAPLLPPSASKSTPMRPGREPLSPSGGEYSMSMDGDSPFPDLSGQKDYNRMIGGQRPNHSHISSNASTSRNLQNSGMSQPEDSYELDDFEDEDDPFGRGSSGPKRTLDLTNITGGSTDIDASKSITIDFVLPSESKDVQRHAQAHSSDGVRSQFGGNRNSRYEEPDISGELDLFSPLGPRGAPFGSTHAGGGGGARDDDDDVLMGTTKLSSTTARDFNNTFQSRATGSDRFDQDSLGGTFHSTQNRGKHSSFSPTPDGGVGEEEGEEEEEESIPPPTYDSMIGTGNTEDSMRASTSILQHSRSLDQDVSSYFELSAEVANHPQHLDIHNIQTEAEAAGIKAPQWKLGRAPVDAIELAAAFDVFVSAVRLDAQHARIYSEIQIKLEFMGIMSELSGVVDLSRTQSVQPVSFSAHLLFSHDQEELLQEEIGELDDAIACQVHVVDAVTQEIVGTASVQLWVMVEDSVNILRQEVEVLNLDLSSEMGSALVDVKGFRLLKKAANAQRMRRTGH